ncbi:MAG: NUDIX hydrolase [Phycisphaerae bacterium]|nr:NUDIX hydrolase [Phycisphaerae bacterium]MDG1899135.1 NUDIX domain-containing protein [Phycisphaerales bacterium]|tara:strand:+ start:3254 stop:3802 length:549 start_codon:yes stop_codon:yes gene_type:complete
MAEQQNPGTVVNADNAQQLPYRIAVLCYLQDTRGRLLMLHRSKKPNAGMHSPIGGKLEIGIGESPHECARREIHEEAGLEIDPSDISFMGMVSEAGYEQAGHWLLFCFRVTRQIDPEEIPEYEFDEGVLEWVEQDDIASLNLPESDRTVLWPMVRKHPDEVFVAHIDCSKSPYQTTIHEPKS